MNIDLRNSENPYAWESPMDFVEEQAQIVPLQEQMILPCEEPCEPLMPVQGKKRPNPSENDLPAKRYKGESSTLPSELWFHILNFSLGKPKSKSLARFSVVCRQWKFLCIDLCVALVNHGVSLLSLFNSIRVYNRLPSVF